MQLDGLMTRLQTEYFLFQCGSFVQSTVYFLFVLFASLESIQSEWLAAGVPAFGFCVC